MNNQQIGINLMKKARTEMMNFGSTWDNTIASTKLAKNTLRLKPFSKIKKKRKKDKIRLT